MGGEEIGPGGGGGGMASSAASAEMSATRVKGKVEEGGSVLVWKGSTQSLYGSVLSDSGKVDNESVVLKVLRGGGECGGNFLGVVCLCSCFRRFLGLSRFLLILGGECKPSTEGG